MICNKTLTNQPLSNCFIKRIHKYIHTHTHTHTQIHTQCNQLPLYAKLYACTRQRFDDSYILRGLPTKTAKFYNNFSVVYTLYRLPRPYHYGQMTYQKATYQRCLHAIFIETRYLRAFLFVLFSFLFVFHTPPPLFVKRPSHVSGHVIYKSDDRTQKKKKKKKKKENEEKKAHLLEKPKAVFLMLFFSFFLFSLSLNERK